MPEFRYRAVNPWGEMVTGSISGDNRMSVRSILKGEGLLPVEIRRGRGSKAFLAMSRLAWKREAGGEELTHFCRQLAVITMSGVNVLKGLDIMAQQMPGKTMRNEINRINREVQKGRTISEAMNDPVSPMPGLLTGMVATGEASGTLDVVLRSMADFYDKEHRVRQKIKTASMYPAIMASMAVGLIAFFFNFLLPQITGMIVSSGGELPALTRIVIGISEFTTRYFIWIFSVLIFIIISCSLYFKTPGGRFNRDACLFRVPLLGRTMRSVATMRFARTSYILIRSGLPLLQGLVYVKQNVGNALAERAIDYAIEGLQRGEALAGNLAKAKYFDPLAVQMFSIGEETGELENILDEMAEYYDKESDAGFNKLLALVEPMMLIIIGSIVSTVIISVMLPMLDMVSHIKR